MARMVKVECPGCGHTWREDYDKLQALNPVYRGEKQKKIEEYTFTCPRDGTTFVQAIAVPDAGAKEA